NASLQLKFMGHVRTVRAAVPHLRDRGGGAIIMVVGNDGLKPSYWEMTAGVANAADINFASSVAEQYGRIGIRCNTVNPGPVATTRWDYLEEAMARDKKISRERAHEITIDSLPLGTICTAQQVADVVVFLASPRGGYVNGAHILLDGGQRKALMDV
ncbi:MAG: SDR family oxidoreductase, partial [Acidimicrobiia bacterium]|nr:SDR family oxidoreductase [Acidimicrobiia bacterium]